MLFYQDLLSSLSRNSQKAEYGWLIYSSSRKKKVRTLEREDLTYHRRLPCCTASSRTRLSRPVLIGSFPSVPGRLGKHPDLPVAMPLPMSESLCCETWGTYEVVQTDKTDQGLRWLHVCHLPVTGSRRLSSLRSWSRCKGAEGAGRARQQNTDTKPSLGVARGHAYSQPGASEPVKSKSVKGKG